MMALYMPMQPSSKTPMIDLLSRRPAAIRRATARARAGTAARGQGPHVAGRVANPPGPEPGPTGASEGCHSS